MHFISREKQDKETKKQKTTKHDLGQNIIQNYI